MSPRRTLRRRVSGVLLALQVIAAALHVNPSLVYPARIAVRTARVVVQLNSLGPLWVLLFGLSGLAMLLTMRWERHETGSHLFAWAVWVLYATSLWLGWAFTTPHGTVFYPVLATAFVALFLIVASSYNEDDVYRAGGRR